jgi:RNA polymerase sigma factor (sigma-70 family)
MEQPTVPGPAPPPTLEKRLAALAGRLQGRALQHTRNEADADDLVQQTLLRACERGDEARNGHFEGWLFTVMHNLWIDECRRRSSHAVVSLDEAGGLHAPIAPDGDPTATLKREDLLAFPDALRDLLADDGQTRLVRFVEALKAVGLDKQRIAEVMGFSEVRSVDAYLSELRKWCREHGVRKEHWLGVLIAITWLSAQESTAAPVVAIPNDHPATDRAAPECERVRAYFGALLSHFDGFLDRFLRDCFQGPVRTLSLPMERFVRQIQTAALYLRDTYTDPIDVALAGVLRSVLMAEYPTREDPDVPHTVYHNLCVPWQVFSKDVRPEYDSAFQRELTEVRKTIMTMFLAKTKRS